jgi:hypothetical protein
MAFETNTYIVVTQPITAIPVKVLAKRSFAFMGFIELARFAVDFTGTIGEAGASAIVP